MALVDSVAEFVSRAKQLGLGDYVEKLSEIGATTFGNMAFATSYTPQGGNEQTFLEEIVTPVLGAASGPLKPALKRLFVESYAFASADVQRRVQGGEAESSAKLPASEREHRRSALSSRLTGLTLDGDLDPSHKLLDLCYTMFDENVVRYIDWSECTSRPLELIGSKVEKGLKVDSNGYLRQVEKTTSDAKAPLGDLLMLQRALQRRGLALDVAGVMSFEAHELWTQVLLQELTRDPPPGYARTSLDQARRADLELWKAIQLDCRAGVRLDADGRLPAEKSITHHMHGPQVRLLLLPLAARGSATSGPASQAKRPTESHDRGRRPDSSAKRSRTDHHSPPRHASGKGAWGKSAGKGASGKGKKVSRPLELNGCWNRDSSGQFLCWSYNSVGGCPSAPAGGSCPKGRHVCMKPDCQKPHPACDHRA